MDQEGRTVLSVAAAQGCVEVVRLLLDRGLDEQHRDNSGWTPLHYAAFEGCQDVCEALLEAGARVCFIFFHIIQLNVSHVCKIEVRIN